MRTIRINGKTRTILKTITMSEEPTLIWKGRNYILIAWNCNKQVRIILNGMKILI